jgi:hypothetical protein
VYRSRQPTFRTNSSSAVSKHKPSKTAEQVTSRGSSGLHGVISQNSSCHNPSVDIRIGPKQTKRTASSGLAQTEDYLSLTAGHCSVQNLIFSRLVLALCRMSSSRCVCQHAVSCPHLLDACASTLSHIIISMRVPALCLMSSSSRCVCQHSVSYPHLDACASTLSHVLIFSMRVPALCSIYSSSRC